MEYLHNHIFNTNSLKYYLEIIKMLSKGTQKVMGQLFRHQHLYPKNTQGHHNFRMFASDSKQAEVDTSIDYYKILGVQYGASDDQIKKSFYDLAKKFHPDSLED